MAEKKEKKEGLRNEMVRKEVLWGASYRKSKIKPLPPKPSPIILPLDKCHEKQRKAREHLKKACKRCRKKLRKQLRLRCPFEPCPPRLVELAAPNKRLVLANWKLYEHLLPLETILRYDELIRHTDKRHLEPMQARHYFKHIDKQKRRKMIKRRKILEKKARKTALMKNIKEIVNCFVRQLMAKPTSILNFQQLQISDQLLDLMEKSNIVKKPKRTTMKPFKRSVLEIADKIAEWIHSISSLVDIDPEILQKHLEMAEAMEEESVKGTISEIASEEFFMEEEEEEEEEEEGEGEMVVEEEAGEEMAQIAFLQEFLEGEGEISMLDDDILNRLIEILSKCPPEFLATLINDSKLPGVTYMDVLEKLKELRDKKIIDGGDKIFLEEAMIDWAKRCDPSKVDSKILKKIHEIAYILQDLLAKKKVKPFVDEKSLVQAGEDHWERPSTAETMLDMIDAEKQKDLLAPEDGGVKGGESGEFVSVQQIEEEILEAQLEKELEEIAEREEGGDIVEEEEVEEEEEEEEEKSEATTVSSVDEEKLAKLRAEAEARAKAPWGDRVIYGHETPEVLEHSPDTICCLSLKVWAVWLLEIAKNAQNWSKWILETVKQVRHYASIVRGDVTLPNGEKQVLYKAEWRKFSKRNTEMVDAWKQYSAHVKELSNQIFARFGGKEVKCCPKCLQDHLIRDVAIAHGTFVALADAINCAGYWHLCLDDIVKETGRLNALPETKFVEPKPPSEASEESGDYIIEEVDRDSEEFLLEEVDDKPAAQKPCTPRNK